MFTFEKHGDEVLVTNQTGAIVARLTTSNGDWSIHFAKTRHAATELRTLLNELDTYKAD